MQHGKKVAYKYIKKTHPHTTYFLQIAQERVLTDTHQNGNGGYFLQGDKWSGLRLMIKEILALVKTF